MMTIFIIDIQARALDFVFDQLEHISRRANARHQRRQQSEIPARVEAARRVASEPYRRLRVVRDHPDSRVA
ncbi:hypothetical protein EON76_06020 [bacterium]|nr:MAG: hypothetical protein EON76_06020 [bacterium]